jgi:3,4-dihydroxy 2-butanone 4-phosphate synthase/GTP cyclohydrolase II
LQVEDRVPLVMDPSSHNAHYLRIKQIKLGHLMGSGVDGGDEVPELCGLTAVVAWHGGDAAAFAAEKLDGLRERLQASGLLVERETDARLLALLDQPQLALLLAAERDQQLLASDLANLLRTLAGWEGCQRISLLLAPDAKRVSHPSSDVHPEHRGLADLNPGPDVASCPRLDLRPGAFVVWSEASPGH